MPSSWTDSLRASAKPRSLAGLALAGVLLFHVLLSLGVPGAWKLIAFAGGLLAFLYIGAANALLVAVSLVIAAGMTEVALRASGLDQRMYYRPHEMLARNHAPWGGHYQPNARLTMTQTFSDLQAMGNIGILEPREIEVQIDSLGFRNRRDYAGQPRVLVGDSFVAGEGNTQPCVITEILREQHGIDAYNLAHPGDDLPHYVSKIRAFRERVSGDARFVLFLYEDNDFGRGPYAELHPARQTALRRYHDVFKRSALHRVSAWLFARIAHKGQALPIVRASVAGSEIAFTPEMLDVVSDARPLDESVMQWRAALQPLAPHIEHIYFIPGKYRVMQPHIDGAAPLPHRQWEYVARLGRELGLRTTDLTTALVEEEGRAKTAGEHVFWRADSHWNCRGINTAAAVVAQTLGRR
jgi:hypothetical protein